MLTFILGEAELEPIPDEIRHHPNVLPTIKTRGRARTTILDGNLHHEALKALPDGERRGRPDLAHYFLVLGLDSLANKTGNLRVLIHTRNDELITVAPETRIMRNYPRFIGLIEQLFAFRKVPKDPVLLTIEEGWPLSRVVAERAKGPVAVFSPKGKRVRLRTWVEEKAKGGDFTCVLGGFPKGDWRTDPSTVAAETVSVSDHGLSVWSVETAILAFYEDATGLLG